MEHTGSRDWRARFDRMEGLMQLLSDDHLKFTDEHRRLLSAQVVLTDRMDKLAQAQTRTEEKIQELTQKQGETTEKLNALIDVVDGIVKRGARPPQ